MYRARESRLGRDVAVKVLPAALAADAERLQRFEQEARAAGVLNHPNVVTVFDVGAASGLPYLVCELLDGESLRARLARGPLGAAQVLDIATQAARGLAAAHARGITHRDLKPENLFLVREGPVKLLDFGVAKLQPQLGSTADAAATFGLTDVGVIVGTADYMSPEQAAGRPVDHRSDIFSFGVVLFEMAAGLRPFRGDTTVEKIAAILRDDPPALTEVRADAPAALQPIISQCLEKDPERRLQSARDLVFALEYAAGFMTTPVSAGGVRPAGAPPLALALVLAGAVLAGLAAGVLLTRRAETTHPAFSRVGRLVATDAAETSPVLSPDGKWVAYLSDAAGPTDVWVKFVTGAQAVNLTAAWRDGLVVSVRRDAGGLDISPDGTQILFDAAVDVSVGRVSSYVIPAPLGGTPRKLIDGGRGARWSPDGTQIAYVVPGGQAGDSIAVADASGEHPREVLPVAGGLHAHWPAWSADGRYVYFIRGVSTTNAEPSEIFRVPAAGGPPERVVATSRRAVFPFPARDGRGLFYSANPADVELSIWWKPDEGQAVRITSGVGEYAEPRLSADGRALVATVYGLRQSLVELPVGSTAAAPIPLTAGFTGDFDPAVSPRGDRIAFSSTRSGDRNIWTARADGSDARQVTFGPSIDERPAWSPDAASLAFVSSRGDERAIWVARVDGGPPRRVITAQVLDTVSWSPDGRELVYAAPAGDVPGLFRVPATGGSPIRIRTPAGATAPNWSAARNLIAYIEARRGSAGTPTQAQPAFVSPAGEPVRSIPALPPLTNGSLAWSPDGRFLAGVSDPGAVRGGVWILPLEPAAAPRRLLQASGDQRFRGVAITAAGDGLIIGLQDRTADIVLFDQGR